MRSSLLVSLCIFSTLATAQPQEAPRIAKEQSGNITNYRAEGSLASTQALSCIPVAEAKSTYAPPDLYKGVLDCLAKDNYDAAVDLFALAGIYARFDAERVADKSAGQARTVLIMNTFAGLSEEKKAKFNTALKRITGTQEVLGKLCGQIGKVGMPSYYPGYMVLHGIKAFTGNPHDGALIKDFDATGAWKNLQSAYLHCPA